MAARLLRRKDKYDEMLGALNPNIELPTRIATQIVDSQYFTRFIGEDLAMGHEARRAAEEHDRQVQAAAADSGAPLAELRAVVDAINQRVPLDPFEGQAAHEARAQQADMAARMATHQRGLAEVHRLAFTTRQAQQRLEESHNNSFQTITNLAQQHGTALGAQGEATAALAERLRRQERRYAAHFRAGNSSSSAGEPEPDGG
jgi:hypothetical protein